MIDPKASQQNIDFESEQTLLEKRKDIVGYSLTAEPHFFYFFFLPRPHAYGDC